MFQGQAVLLPGGLGAMAGGDGRIAFVAAGVHTGRFVG